MRLARLAILTAFAVVSAARAADDLGPVKEQAVRLYDRGMYDEARKTLEELDLARALDGPLLYRLFFCEKATGHSDEARRAIERARAALETEITSSASLEVAFYLANTYSNLGRSADAQGIARGVTTKIESGQVAAPTSAIGLFQLGKLYEDQSRQKEASAYYTKAVDAFDLKEGRYTGNAAWALRYLGNVAYARADFEASERALARRTALPGAEAADWNTLAAARARLGKYAPAAEAWKSSIRVDPGNGDDPRYAARLADAAARLAPLPKAPPGGAAFTAMNETDLKAFLKTCSEAAMTDIARATEAMGPEHDGALTHRLDPKRRAEVGRTLREARQRFVAAALEFAVRGYGIRDTAFGDGYAALIFQDGAWELPPDPGPPAKAALKRGS
jgi:tetratricopeptide (TPR) repeat protein